MTGQDLITLADTRIGDSYILGSMAPKNDANYHGPWDCAEYVSWIVFQVTGQLVGCLNNNSKHPETSDAGTIYFERDVKDGVFKMVSLAVARATPGAIVLRYPAAGVGGHIIFSKGNGKTSEAHGHADGVVNIGFDNRRWDCAFLLYGVDYKTNPLEPLSIPVTIRMGAHNDPAQVKVVQSALFKAGFPVDVDGDFGEETLSAVRSFQDKHGLTADGEVGKDTKAALGLSI